MMKISGYKKDPKMVAGGDTHASVPSYLNPDNLVEGALDGVAQHREHTRQVLR